MQRALAVSLVLCALCSPLSKSATYFPLYFSAAFALALRLRAEGGFRLPRNVARLALLWALIAIWQLATLLANGDTLSAVPVTRALDFTPVFLLAGLPLEKGWKEKAAKVSFFSLTSLTALIILLGLFQAATATVYPFPIQPFSEGKLLGFFSHHIPAGGFFSTLAVITACLLLFWKSSLRTKISLGVLFMLLLSGSLLSLSRTYFVSLCLTLPLLFFKKNLRAAAVGTTATALFIAAAVLLLPPVKSRMTSILDLKQNPSNVERLYLWRVARDMIEANPVAGIGYRQWGDKISGYSGRYASEWKFTEASFHHAHNVYLHVAAETGLVGLALFLAFWLSLLVMLFRVSASAAGDGFARGMILGVAFAIVNLLIGGFFENNFGTLLIALLLSYVVSLALFVMDGTGPAVGCLPPAPPGDAA